MTTSSAINEFSFSLPLDNGLLIADIQNGLPIDSVEVLSLASQAQSLFISTTLESRALGSVDKCHQLWSEAAGLFSELCDSWAGIDSDEQSIIWLRGRLVHYHELALDRCGLYSISESERLMFARCKAFESDSKYSFGTRGEIEPVREFSKLETASIERAYRRL